MAEEKKEKKRSSEKLYGKPPKIEPAPKKGDTVKSEGGAPKEAAKEAEKSAGDPVTKETHSEIGESGTEAKGDVMAGTDGIPTSHTESGDGLREHMKDLHSHHERMMRDLHEHHMQAMKEIGKRHLAMHTKNGESGGMKEEDIGKGGEEEKT